ncbi:MAG TPA: hypothetical protein VK149_06165 [Sideroxyarcus sp.]|nr:hypothetical protein [Sideroxyarcus sp.]
MKQVSTLFAALLGCCALSAQAEGFFAGGEFGTTAYPDFAGPAAQSAINTGFASASATQDKASTAFGVYGGQWLTGNLGWEAGYTDLGSIAGTVTTTGPAATATYKYSATALYAAALGGMKLGKGTLYGKAGLYSASVKYDETIPPGVGVATPSTDSSIGLVIGGGYSVPFMEHLVGKAELAIYNGVKFHEVMATGTKSDTITKVSIGVAYAF